jgi:hypothetical protein
VVVQVDADAIADAEWLVLREDGRTRVAFLFGIVPERLVALERKIELPCLHLRLLKTEEIGIELTEYLTEALTLAGPQSIHIPTDKFHLFRHFGRKVTKKLTEIDDYQRLFISLQRNCNKKQQFF